MQVAKGWRSKAAPLARRDTATTAQGRCASLAAACSLHTGGLCSADGHAVHHALLLDLLARLLHQHKQLADGAAPCVECLGGPPAGQESRAEATGASAKEFQHMQLWQRSRSVCWEWWGKRMPPGLCTKTVLASSQPCGNHSFGSPHSRAVGEADDTGGAVDLGGQRAAHHQV